MSDEDVGTRRESIPTPDPTTLTTEQMLREVGSLRREVELLIKGQVDNCNEKFQSIDRELALIERQRVEQKADTRLAVDAALSAAKEAVKEQTAASERSIGVANAATTEQLKQISTTFGTQITGLVENLNDLKDRINRTEGKSQGLGSAGNIIVAVILVGAAIVSIIIATRPGG